MKSNEENEKEISCAGCGEYFGVETREIEYCECICPWCGLECEHPVWCDKE